MQMQHTAGGTQITAPSWQLRSFKIQETFSAFRVLLESMFDFQTSQCTDSERDLFELWIIHYVQFRSFLDTAEIESLEETRLSAYKNSGEPAAHAAMATNVVAACLRTWAGEAAWLVSEWVSRSFKLVVDEWEERTYYVNRLSPFLEECVQADICATDASCCDLCTAMDMMSFPGNPALSGEGLVDFGLEGAWAARLLGPPVFGVVHIVLARRQFLTGDCDREITEALFSWTHVCFCSNAILSSRRSCLDFRAYAAYYAKT